MSGGPPSFSSVRPGAPSSSSSGVAGKKPVSFQRSINDPQKPPSQGDVDPRAKNSTNKPVQSGYVIILSKSGYVLSLLMQQEDYDIWRPKLLENYQEILKLSKYSRTRMKKNIYNLLIKGIFLQDDNLLFTLGSNGEGTEIISARTFSYRNGNPHDNWCINVPKSRFKMVAQMFDISNLMIKIETRAQFLSPNTEYGVYLVFKFCDSRNVSRTPMYVDLKYRKGNETLHAYFSKWRADEWMMIELYRFLNHKDDGDFEVLLESLSASYCREHDAIYVEGIEFQPIDNVEHEETEKSRKVQKVLESNSNLDQFLQMPTKSEMILKGSINYDYGEELVSLNEVNGKKHLMLSAKAALYNSSDLELFVPKPTPKSRFEEVLELLPQQIFRISCTVKSQMLSRDADYVCYLVFKLSENCNEMHGPVKVRDLLQKIKVSEFVYFRTPSPWNIHNITQIPKQRSDGWMEVNVKKFNSNLELENDCVRVNLKILSYEGSLSGLIVSGLEFRPM
ncbi:uncharacterized protein LOC143529594 [Bidens hawaiensis]|uniref:uncharacterized protein LOC143529593 n=1 Tax=Bidens hawaiensis TaxID=980011 RepID=UPI004049B3FE